MNRIDRLTAMIIHLQGKSRITLQELEDRFEVGRRTIFRDIKSLLASGVPIGGDAGIGYFIVEGYHLPPVVFNKEEAATLLIAAKLMGQNADADTNRLMDDVTRKVRAVLKYSDRDYLEALDNRVAILGSPSVSKQSFPDSHISAIQMALATKRVMEISYYSSYNDSHTVRTVAPLGLVYYSNRWHMIGYCELRQSMRDFRTDRIQKLNITVREFNPAEHPDYLKFTQGMLGGTDAKEATILFSKTVARLINEQKYYYGFLEEKEVEAGVEMKFITPHYDFLARWLLSFTKDATVIFPSELQGKVASYSKELLEHHRKYFS
ncbi:MAG: putative DNA-binding transcriptional regulator YafY [Cyclobacteriaceae bacterium]|jgi:predicted DNA-binding transcriptional regulator YafY